MEWLGDVVVGTQLEAADPVVQLAPGREHHHGHVALGTNAGEEREAVLIRETDVQDHHVRRPLTQRTESFRGGGRRDDGISLLAQADLDEIDDPGLIVDHEHERLCVVDLHGAIGCRPGVSATPPSYSQRLLRFVPARRVYGAPMKRRPILLVTALAVLAIVVALPALAAEPSPSPDGPGNSEKAKKEKVAKDPITVSGTVGILHGR